MPWKETSVLEQKKLFILRYGLGELPFCELCEEFGVSRKTGYKWIKRFEVEGFKGLEELSRRPHNFRQQTPNEILFEIIRIKNWKEHWGGKKIYDYLKAQEKFESIPHSRTIERYLKSCGYITPRKPNWRKDLQSETLIDAKEPNDVWTLDFKGWWRTKDKRQCNPLTIRDMLSRYLLNLSAHAHSRGEDVKERFIRLFEEFGIPKVIRMDNGNPFACVRAMHRLTSFSTWLMKHGVLPNRMDPASPHQNGAHERLHGDIKKELQINPAENIKQEQKRFDLWRYEFNHLRPHESLHGDVPAKHYKRSSIKYQGEKSAFEYPSDFSIRKVSSSGNFNWNGKPFVIAKSLASEYIGIEECEAPELKIWYCDFCLAHFNPKSGQISPVHPLVRKDIGKRVSL